MNNQIFKYNGSDICFQTEGESVMVNATEMAKPFGKLTADFLKTKRALDFIDSLVAMKNIIPTELVIVKNGGTSFGTWMHEDIAIEFARWLSPAFAIWCNDRIKELFKHGLTAMPDTIEKILADPSNTIKILTALENERMRNMRLQTENLLKEKRLELQDREIKLAIPKVEYCDTVLQSKTAIATTVIANGFGMTAQGLNKFLVAKKVIRKVNRVYVLCAEFINKGFDDPQTFHFNKTNGEIGTKIELYWTEKGRLFIHGLFKIEAKS
jgi:phage antirepressor YoqD-like protein